MAMPVLKRLLVGHPVPTARMREARLPKWLALPVFCSDPISSVAYASEQILLVLAEGGAAAISGAKWIALGVIALLLVVTASYRQTCRAYPSGGGAYVVSRTNLGRTAGLTAAAALLTDYVMTVAVSIVTGVVAITSAVPEWAGHQVSIAVGFVLLLALGNLRGVKESGRVFAVPTYAFIALTAVMFGVAAVRSAEGTLPYAATANAPLPPQHAGGMLFGFLVLRAFSSGCTALTGVEAVTNGVPTFRSPRAKNAATTLAIMSGVSVTLFGGVTLLALALHARAMPDGNPSVISQVAAAVFGPHATLFYLFQAATAAILVLAANTAFNGFPTLASILAKDGYLPKQLHTLGDRLVFSNGILLLAGCAVALVIGFDANPDRLIQLYIVGVFTGFTLSQIGMVRHWNRALATGETDGRSRAGVRRSQTINAVGAAATGIVLVVVFVTKVEHGAWLAVLAMGVMFVVMKGIHRYYQRVQRELEPEPGPPALPSRVHGLVLVSRLHKPALRALAFARATRPDTLTAISASADAEEAEQLQREWDEHRISVPLQLVEAPYRDIYRPLLDRIAALRDQAPRDLVTVFIPEYVVPHWWENLLHNQSALRLKARLLFTPGVVVINVPYRIGRAAQGWLGRGETTSAE